MAETSPTVNLVDVVTQVAQTAQLATYFRAGFILVSGLGLAVGLSRMALRFIRDSHPQARMVAQRGIVLLVGSVAIFASLQELGFDVSVLLGAAGVFSVALAFASQTTASNVISGLFLIGEAPFVVGDSVKIGTTVGEVLSIDSLSVKLRTPDNLLVRVPNETVIKSEVTNLSRFPLRRLELSLAVPYTEDLAHVRRVLLDLARSEPECMEEPEASVTVVSLGESAIQLLFHVWVLQSNLMRVKSRLLENIHIRFAREKIEAPYPRMKLDTSPEELALLEEGGAVTTQKV